MSEYVETGYIEPNYIEGDENSPIVASCDLSSLEAEFDEIETTLLSFDDKVDMLYSVINSIQVSVSYMVNNFVTKADLQNKTIDLSNLATKLQIENLNTSIEHIILPSLNGNGSEYKDGTEVKVSGREAVYTVERSYHSLYSDNGYTVHYDLVSSDGYRVTAPEALLTKYTPTVV